MKVSKFGGTSLATAERIRKVCEIIIADPERRLIVVSAPGKRYKDDIKVTDLLIACAKRRLERSSAEDELQAVIARYREIAQGLALPEEIVDMITADLRGRLAMDASNRERFIDAMKAGGEDNCAKLVAQFLRSMGVEARYINPKDAGLLVSNEYGNARVLPESYENLRTLRSIPGVMIFPGFFGYSPEGYLVTFSRGGSDITGSILAAAVGADIYENFTDVDSVFAVDPNIVPHPRAIPELTYREMRELSYSGFSVFHEEAFLPVFRSGIPVCIKNTNNPHLSGTMIVPKRQRTASPVVGIASDTGFCIIYLSKYLMNREIGFGRRLLQILEEENLSYEHTPSGIDNISVILREKQFDLDTEARVVQRIRDELEVDDIAVERDLALIMIVGEGMRHTVGIAARATGALARAGVNIEMINQGSSEISMMFGVKATDNVKAVRALYREFFEV
ncbi:MAG: aspartate kinase [bacterium]